MEIRAEGVRPPPACPATETDRGDEGQSGAGVAAGLGMGIASGSWGVRPGAEELPALPAAHRLWAATRTPAPVALAGLGQGPVRG